MVSPSNFVHEIVPPFYFLHDAGAFVEVGSYNVQEFRLKICLIFIHFSEDLNVLKLFVVSWIAFENVKYSQKGN